MDQEPANMRRLFSNWMSIIVSGLSLVLLHCLQFPIRLPAAAVSIPLFVQFCSRERIIKKKHIICTPFELPIVSSESSAYSSVLGELHHSLIPAITFTIEPSDIVPAYHHHLRARKIPPTAIAENDTRARFPARSTSFRDHLKSF
jgi:hypothetical protein